MASTLIDTSDLDVHVQSGLPAARLEEIIDGADAEIIRLAGPHDGSRKVILRADISRSITLPSPADSITEVKEWSDGILEANGTVITDYQSCRRRAVPPQVGGLLEAERRCHVHPTGRQRQAGAGAHRPCDMGDWLEAATPGSG